MRARAPRKNPEAVNAGASTSIGLLPAQPDENAPLRQWALWHAAVGRLTGAYKVFPCKPGQKEPRVKWQDEATWDVDRLAAFWRDAPQANIGLAVQPDFVVLDLDDYKDGAKSALSAFEAQHGEPPRTLEFRSARGGYHLIYRTSKPLGNSRGALPTCIDVRGFGGYIVGAGSVFQGSRYKVEHAVIPEMLPPHIEAMLKQRTATERVRRTDYGEPIDWDYVQAKNLVALVDQGKIIKDYRGPFVEGERDNLTFQLMALAKGRMIHPDVILDAVAESGIDGGLDDDDGGGIEKKMQSAYHDGNTQDGYGAKVISYTNYLLFRPKYDVEYLPLDPVAWKKFHPNRLPTLFPGDPQPVDASGALAQGASRNFYYLDKLDAIPEPTWAIEDVLPEGGYTLVYGQRSTKKSFAALDMGLCVATGTAYHKHPVKHGRVVYFAGEGFRGVKRRVRAWFQLHKLQQEDHALSFALVPFTAKWDTERGKALVRETLKQIAAEGDILLVIIDTARRAMSGDENAPTAVGQFLDGVSEICGEFGCGSLIVHHAGKDATKGARGGGPFEDDADAVFRFGKGDGGAVDMKCTKQKDSEADWRMLFRPNVIELGRDSSGKAVTSLVLTLVAEDRSDSDAATEPQTDRVGAREFQVRFILAALRTFVGRQWKLTELAGEARKQGCTIPLNTLRTDVLGSKRSKPGWARSHPVLAPYFDSAYEAWRTPHILPQTPAGYEMKYDEDQ